jgi:hypothetical protein
MLGKKRKRKTTEAVNELSKKNFKYFMYLTITVANHSYIQDKVWSGLNCEILAVI